jgi:integrase
MQSPMDLSSPEAVALFLQHAVAQGVTQALQQAPAPTPPTGPPARLVKDLWADYKRTLRDIPSAFDAHGRWFLNLPFDHEGTTIKVGDQPWTALTPRMGIDWWTELRRQPLPLGKKGQLLSAAYCNRLLTTAAGMFTYHVNLAIKTDSRVRALHAVDEVTENPLRRWPHAPESEMGERFGSFRDDEHLESFLACCRPTMAEMVYLACHNGGMRRSEVRLLEWVNVNLDARRITLRKDQNKNGESRTFPIEDDRSFKILSERYRNRKGSFVFTTEHSKSNAVCSRTVDDWMKQAGRDWGQQLDHENVVFHHCRHTWAKWSILRGTPINLIMEWGGWKSMSVFAGYTKATEQMLEQARRTGGKSIRDIMSDHVAIAAPERKAPRRSRYEPVETQERKQPA